MNKHTAKKKVAGFKPAYGCHLSQEQAERYGTRLLELAQANNDTLTKEQVVEDARDAFSPLHDYFEWDDDVAAELYRLTQAGEIIRYVRVVYERDDGYEELPVLVNVRIDLVDDEPDPWPDAPEHRGAKQAYTPLPAAMSDTRKLAYLIRSLLRDLESLKVKHGKINHPAVQELFQAIQRLEGKLLEALK